MLFIDKETNRVQGHTLVNNFLISRWDDATSCYSEIGYNSIEFRNQVKQLLKLLLLHEQQYRCCYCMREIANDDTTTLEHLVPKSTTSVAHYNLYKHNRQIDKYVCLQSVFVSSNIPLNTPPFPLEIAYDNLAASCKGDFPGGASYHICNHKRRSEYIELLCCIPSIEHELTYTKGGLLFSNKTTYNQSIIHLNLNYNSLEQVRQIWYHISVEDWNAIQHATTDMERNTILTINLISLPPAKRKSLIATYKQEVFWNILLKYSWFYSYYKAQFPAANR
jgi:hypothetical protein